MKNFLGALLKAYAAIAAYTLTLIAVIVGYLFWSGSLTGDRVKAAVKVLRTQAPGAAAVESAPVARPEEMDEQLTAKKVRDLHRLEDRVVAQLAQLKAEQAEADRRRQESLAAAAEARKAQADLAQAGSDAEIEANLPMLSKMDGPAIVDLMKSWDDPRFVRYLRAMRPAKAAEVLESIRTDPEFEVEFRRVPPEAPPGTKTRAERLAEEFVKAR